MKKGNEEEIVFLLCLLLLISIIGVVITKWNYLLLLFKN